MNRSFDKSKILNIILIVLALIVLGFCLYLVFTTKGYEGSEVTLLRDMDSEEIRLIKDKTDVYNNAEGTIVMKGEKPIDYIEPDEVFKGEVKEYVPPVDNSKLSVFVGNPNKGELREFNPETDYQVLQEEELPIGIKPNRISLNDALFVLRQIRNEGLKAANWGTQLVRTDGSQGSIYSIAGDNGAVLVPFNMKNQKQLENLKKWSDIYSNGGFDIPVIFLNTSTYIRESEARILAYFEENGISKDIPVCYDEYHEISDSIKQSNIDNLGYCIVNRDGYIYEKGALSSSVNMTAVLNDLNTIMNEYIEQEALITEKYEAGYIWVYEDVQKALNGTLEEVSGFIQNETDIEESQTE